MVVAGSTDGIRSVQQWLNGRYRDRSAYSIGPCDGIYSRDVQKALVLALQYEMGIAEPNGNCGPATQSGLRNHTLSQGDSGVFVQLFCAACLFNSPAYDGDDNPVATTWRSTFDAGLAEWVSVFRQFDKLTVNGSGDYETWAQLLVSMGDPDRPATGSDTRYGIPPRVPRGCTATGTATSAAASTTRRTPRSTRRSNRASSTPSSPPA